MTFEYAVIGYATPTGLGSMNYDLVQLGKAVAWFVPPPNKLESHKPYLKHCRLQPTLLTKEQLCSIEYWREATKNINVVVFVERPPVEQTTQFVKLFQQLKKQVCCIPNWEGFPDTGWSTELDMLWATSNHARLLLPDIARRQGDRCRWTRAIGGNAWGVNLKEFKFSEQTTCSRFLFANGHGGQHGRKGLDTLAELLGESPELPFTVVSEVPVDALPGYDVEYIIGVQERRSDAYRHGNVLVSLSHWEGLGLPLYEAQACGLPTVALDAAPMNEAGDVWPVPAVEAGTVQLRARRVKKWSADIKELQRLLKTWHQKNIMKQSRRVRSVIEKVADLRITVAALETFMETQWRSTH